MISLTPRQKAVLDFISNRIAETGCAPSVREIAVGTGLAEGSVGTVHATLTALEQRGYIRRFPRQSRAIEIINHSVECPNCGHSFPNSAAVLPSPAVEALGTSQPPFDGAEGINRVEAA